jgi:hypothetical protein
MGLKSFFGEAQRFLLFLFWICIFYTSKLFEWSEFCFYSSFCLQSPLKFSFLLIVLTTKFGDATKLFIIIYFFFLKKSDRLLA